MKRTLLTLSAAALMGVTPAAFGVIVASENFDGGALNLITSTVPTLDGGPGDSFAVGRTAAWPTAGGTPFSLVDTSVGAVGDSGAFPGDAEGVYGVNSNFNNHFLGLSDSDEFGAAQTASWTFNVAGFTNLELAIGMGSMEGSTFTYDPTTHFTFQVSIDAGPVQTAFSVVPNAAGDGYAYRALDDGNVVVANTSALWVTGDNPVTKILADTLAPAGNTFVDKSPASGSGAGQLDSFTTAINGSGSQLVLTMTANLPFEAIAFDDFVITGVPEPGTLGLLALGAVVGFIRRR
jgi:hypothetical protein